MYTRRVKNIGFVDIFTYVRGYSFLISFDKPKSEAFGIRFIAHSIYTLRGGGEHFDLNLQFLRGNSLCPVNFLDDNYYIYLFTDIKFLRTCRYKSEF